MASKQDDKVRAARCIEQAMNLLRASAGEPDLLVQAAIDVTQAARLFHTSGVAAHDPGDLFDKLLRLEQHVRFFQDTVR